MEIWFKKVFKVGSKTLIQYENKDTKQTIQEYGDDLNKNYPILMEKVGAGLAEIVDYESTQDRIDQALKNTVTNIEDFAEHKKNEPVEFDGYFYPNEERNRLDIIGALEGCKYKKLMYPENEPLQKIIRYTKTDSGNYEKESRHPLTEAKLLELALLMATKYEEAFEKEEYHVSKAKALRKLENIEGYDFKNNW
jgi:hypothetical protein